MRIWPVALGLAVIAAAGCAAEDEWPVRPPGGGTGTGSQTEGDAQTSDAGNGDAAAGVVNGLICVVSDLRQPDACPVTPARAGVAVRRAGTQIGVTSDTDGR